MKKKLVWLLVLINFSFLFFNWPIVFSKNSFPNLKLSFPAGEKWMVTQGYHGSFSHNEQVCRDCIYAIDFSLPNAQCYNKPILAAADGIARTKINKTENGRFVGYGKYIEIDHGDYVSLYAHLLDFAVKDGQKVKQGEIIGYCDSTGYSTGNHLHFSFFKKENGKLVPVKPEPISGYTNFEDRVAYGKWYISDNKLFRGLSVEETPNKNSNSNQGMSSIVRPSPTPTKGEGAIGEEPILSFWDKFLFQTKRIINSFKFKEDIQEKKPLKSIPAISSKSPVWRQRLIERSVPTWTFILGESQPINRVKFKFQNIGDTTWRKDEVFLNIVGGYQGTAAKLYHKSWITKLRPCGFQENEVKPGQSGTFEFIFSYPQKEGKYYAQFSLSRYDKKQNKWYWIEGDRAILYITVKKKSSILSYGSANVSKAFSWNSSSSNQNQNNNQNNTQSQNSPPQNPSLPLSNQEENNPNTSLLSFPMAHYNTSKTGWLPFLGPYQNPQKEIFISDTQDESYFNSPSIDSKGNIYFNASLNSKKGLYSFDSRGNLRFFVECSNSSPLFYCLPSYQPPTLFEEEGLIFDVLSMNLVAIDISTGKIIWQKNFGGVYESQHPVIDKVGNLYFVASACLANHSCIEMDQRGNLVNLKEGLFSFDSKTGRLNWFYSFKEGKKYQEQDINLERNGIMLWNGSKDFTLPVVDKKGLIYIGNKKKLFVINQNGEVLKQKEFIAYSCDLRMTQGLLESFSWPLINYISVDENNYLYVSLTSERYEGCDQINAGWRSCLHSLNKNTLEENWQEPICSTEDFFNSFVVAPDGKIFLVRSLSNNRYPYLDDLYLSVFSSAGKVIKEIKLREASFRLEELFEILVDKHENVYLSFNNFFSKSIIDYLKIFDKNLQPQGEFSFYYPEELSPTFSISPDGTLYIGSGKALYKITSSK